MSGSPPPARRRVGRYLLCEEIASGGMASVHFGRLVGEEGFSRVVAIKRPHPQHAKDPSFVAMLRDEARLASRVRHPNVVPILDVVSEGGELLLVMEYVHGDSMATMERASLARGGPMPAQVASSIVGSMLEGLAAAHAATNEEGEPLGLVHRDVSPENVLVGADGVARVVDFGIALASGRLQTTREGTIKGKLAYMAPELLEGEQATPLSDVYSAGVVLWEALVGRPLFTGAHEGALLAAILRAEVLAPSSFVELPAAVDAVVLRAVARDPSRRYASAHDFARDLEAALPPAPARDVAAWVQLVDGPHLQRKAQVLALVERTDVLDPTAPFPTEAIEAPPTEPLPTAQVVAPAPAVVTEVIPPPTNRDVRGAALGSARRTGAIALGSLMLVTCAGGAAILKLSTSAARDVVSAAAPLPTVAEPPAESATAAEAATAVPVSSQASAPPERPTATAEEKPPKRSQRPRAAQTAKPVADCNPPYTVDDRGIHHYKPGCL